MPFLEMLYFRDPSELTEHNFEMKMVMLPFLRFHASYKLEHMISMFP